MLIVAKIVSSRYNTTADLIFMGMQFNPWNNITLPVVPFYVRRSAHDQLCELELSAPERLHRALIDDGPLHCKVESLSTYLHVSISANCQCTQRAFEIGIGGLSIFRVPGESRANLPLLVVGCLGA